MNNFKEYVFNHKYHLFAGIMVIIIAVIILVASNTHGNTDFDYNEGDDTTDYATEYTTYYEDTTETTTVSLAVKCHYNADGKLYGEKGKFSGLWPQLEQAAKSSNEQYIKDLMVYVGDNTELKKSDYEEDKFTKINGYGTVHWSQSGHKWPNKYSASYSGFVPSVNLFDTIKIEEKPENMTSSLDNGALVPMADISLSDSAILMETTTEETTEELTETTTSAYKAASTNKTKSIEGSVWGSNSCGVCSLAMALSTLSGVTVSPPEVALAANLLIGKSAWYDTILYSKSQAKLAQLAGFNVNMEPYNNAKKETMDACLNANGVALFVTNKSPWVTNGRHYIMVRNKVGDKYYTADSGNNPTKGFTYEELSSGYCQQYIVYIYPKK
ncbi:MAG: hypothetical protein ACI4VF_00645 [Lachnospirales bacterium]